MFKRLAAALILAAGLPLAGQTGERVVVVELYTSQGCSSCPPADALLGELSARDDVIPLALHVDYWDYIGWKDEFADPAHTERQKKYAYASGQRTIYTPQMIVGGLDHVVGYKPMQLAKFIQTHSAVPEPVAIALTRDGGSLTIAIPAADGLGETVVQLVRYTPKANVEIRRGENRGRTLAYHNIVNELRVIADWDGTAAFQQTMDVSGDAPIVVFLQAAGHGPILAAARLH
ncbi:MAG: DUF1223 domain-containing protein [Pseudomonadota bacterium]